MISSRVPRIAARRHRIRTGTTPTVCLFIAASLLGFYLLSLTYSVWLHQQLVKSDVSGQKVHLFGDLSDARASSKSSFRLDAEKAENLLRKHGSRYFFRPITAYLEPPLNDTILGTGNRGDLRDDNDLGAPPEFVVPLPLRTHSPEGLRRVEYHGVRTCHDMPGKFPIDRGLQYDPQTGRPILWNLGAAAVPDEFAEQELPFCPVEADPWLPWIHDVFPSPDGRRIEFIAQNKRKCRTGRRHDTQVNRLVPQAALLQSVSVERITEREARALAPGLWHPASPGAFSDDTPRYRLAPYNESSPDAMFTRFICRFHAIELDSDPEAPQSMVLGETLSEYPFNYEFVAYRKPLSRLLSAKGRDTLLFWTTTLRFHCPVPPDLSRRLADGGTVLSDGSPLVRLDLVPIRTAARYGNEFYLTEDQIGPRSTWEHQPFDPVRRWGPHQVVPRVEASGRWANLPICHPPTVLVQPDGTPRVLPELVERPQKLHVLSACLWASAEFRTRGGAAAAAAAQTDTEDRFREWLAFHRLVGFDHVYLFDNSGAHTNASSLARVAAQHPDFVTRIDWPAVPCNNNPPTHDSCGERSSQYAAENACRTRYAPFTRWLVAFDTDEYLVPARGDSLKDVLADAERGGAKILSFFSARSLLRPDQCEAAGTAGLRKRRNVTFLEAYNCDSGGVPKPGWASRAKKQVYLADYVPYHFVHFATVTAGLLQTYREAVAAGGGASWTRRRAGEQAPVERRLDERREATMVHAKAVPVADTENYRQDCVPANLRDHARRRCWVAHPWPDGVRSNRGNCYVNERVETYWIPKLREALANRP